MTRSTDQWRGKTDDTPVPPRVRLRQFERDGGRCQCGCGILIRPGDKWETDHRHAIVLGGANDESNLRTLLVEHHKIKTKADVATKAKNDHVRMKHLGIRAPSRLQSRGFPPCKPQRTASKPLQKGFRA